MNKKKLSKFVGKFKKWQQLTEKKFTSGDSLEFVISISIGVLVGSSFLVSMFSFEIVIATGSNDVNDDEVVSVSVALPPLLPPK